MKPAAFDPAGDNLAHRLRVAREWIPRLTELHAPSYVRETLKDLVDHALERRTERSTIVFQPIDRTPGAERWLIHRAGEPPAVFACNLLGLTAAWLAIGDRCRSNAVRASDLAAPDAKNPSIVVRKAIREDAVPWIERMTSIRELAAEALAVRIEGGLLRYSPRLGAPIIDTGID